MRAAHQALHYHASQANLALESDAWASLVDPRNARAAPGVARRTFGRAHPPCGRQRVRGAHLSRARDFAADSFARQRSTPLSRARFRGGFVRASEERTSLARTRLPRVRFWDFPKVPSRPSRSCPSPPPRCLPPRALASRTARSAAMPSTRATRRFSSARAPTPRRRRCASTSTASRDPRVASPRPPPSSPSTRPPPSTRAPRPRASPPSPPSRPSRATTRPWRASARHVPHRPERLPVARPRSSPRAPRPPPPGRRYPRAPRPSPHRFHLTHPRRRRRRLRHAPSRRRLLFGLEDGRVIVRGQDLDVERPSRAVVVHPPDGWRGCAGGVRLLAQLPDDADERLNDQTADTDGIRTRARTRACSRRTVRVLGASPTRRAGEWRVSSSSPGPHPEFADPARLVPLRERSRRARRPPRVGAVRLASDGAALYLSSPVVGEHCVYRWDLPPESEEEGDAASGRKALGKHAWGSVTRLELHTDAVRCLAELPAAISRNVGLVSGGDDCVVATWRPRFDPTASRIVDMACVNHTRTPAATRALAISLDGCRLFTAGADKNVRAWDTSDVDGRGFVLLRAFLGGHAGFVASLAIVDPSNPTHVVSGGRETRAGSGAPATDASKCGARETESVCKPSPRTTETSSRWRRESNPRRGPRRERSRAVRGKAATRKTSRGTAATRKTSRGRRPSPSSPRLQTVPSPSSKS